MPSRWLAEMVFLRRGEVISRTASPSTSMTEEVRPPGRAWICLRSMCMFAPFALGCGVVLCRPPDRYDYTCFRCGVQPSEGWPINLLLGACTPARHWAGV